MFLILFVLIIAYFKTINYICGTQIAYNLNKSKYGAGGKVVMGKTLIDEETGYFAIFKDTEGNLLSLHSQE